MNPETQKVQRIYLTLLLFNTLAASLIWGINTLFLLDAGLSNAQAFAANAFFTVGMLLFEIPTGVIADLRGRRLSYLLGVFTLIIATLLYLLMWYIEAPFWGWAVSSILLGLGFTFFSGCVEAWLVDALTAKGYTGKLENVFAKGEIVEGIAMLSGSIAGGIIAQVSNIGVPYFIRVIILGVTFVLAFATMKDIGFTPAQGKHPLKEVKMILKNSISHGFGNRPVRFLMLASPFTMGVSIFAFYAMQPYLLELYGNPQAYGIAGLAAAIVAGAQILGGILVPYLSKIINRRTTALLVGLFLSSAVLLIIGLIPNFWVAVSMLVIWALMFAALTPIRQSFLNELIPSEQRATVLSFDSLLGSSGGVVTQPVLGKAADVWSYPISYMLSAGIQAIAIPFTLLARKTNASADRVSKDENLVKQN